MSDRCWRTTRRSPKPFGAPNTAGTSDSEPQDWHGRENEVRHKRATPRKMRARRPAVASWIVIGVPSGRLAVAVSRSREASGLLSHGADADTEGGGEELDFRRCSRKERCDPARAQATGSKG